MTIYWIELPRVLKLLNPVFPIHFVRIAFGIMTYDWRYEYRERYPLTSQLIQENKIPEFGLWIILRIATIAHGQ